MRLGEVGGYDPPFVSAFGIYHALQNVIRESDVLLALQVNPLTNSGTARDFLVTTYREQIPVVGFSEGLVTAGALLSLYSTPRQYGRHGAEIAARILAGEAELPPPQFPAYFTVRVNTSVARFLGLQMQDETELTAALGKAAGQRTGAAGEPGSTQARP